MAVDVEKYNPNQNYAVAVNGTSAAVAVNQGVGSQPYPTNYDVVRVFFQGTGVCYMAAANGTNTATATVTAINSVPIPPNQPPEKLRFNFPPASLAFIGYGTGTAYFSLGGGGV